MAGLSIPRPSTTVEQEFVAETPSYPTPSQQSCVVGPCYQIVSAFDDNQLPLDAAYAGPYRDGLGVISYDFPSLIDGALVADFLADIRVFLVLGSESTELNSSFDEATVFSGAGGELDGTSAADTVFTDPGVDFVTEGVVAGDAIRFSYKGRTVDIIVDAVAATELGLDDDSVTDAIGDELEMGGSIDLTLATYTIIRNPAQFQYSAVAANASAQFGPASAYFQLGLKADAGEEFQGSAGDGVQAVLSQQPAFLADDTVFTGEHIFWAVDQGEDFLVSVGPAGAAPAGFLLFTGAAGGANAFRDVLYVVSSEILIIDADGAGTVNADYKVLSQATTSDDGVTAGGDETDFSSAGAAFNTTIPNTAGTPDADTYLEINGNIVTVVSVDSDTELTLGAGAGAGLSGETYTVGTLVLEETAKGNTGTANHVCFAGGGLTSDIVTGRAIIAESADDGNTWEGALFDSLASEAYLEAYLATGDAAYTAYGVGTSGEIVAPDQPIALLWDSDTRILTIQLARGADGLSTGGVVDPGDNDGLYIDGALTDPDDPSYSAAVAAIFEFSESGASSIVFNEGAGRSGVTLVFDGGTDVGDLLLDENLIGSTTPTARIHVSYKALRTDVTAAAEDPLFYEINDATQVVPLLGDLPGNPLAIAAWFNLASAPRSPVRALGVSDADAANPNGTSTAYGEAFAFLESKSVYVIVPLTQDPVVGQLLTAHVDAMSEPENAAERLGIVNSQMPTHSQAEVIASGITGNTATVEGEATAEFTTSVDFALAAAEPGDVIVVAAKAGAAEHLEAVNGTIGPLYGATITAIKTTDRFVLEFDGTDFPSDWNDLVDVTWTLYRPGSAISIPADQAEAIAKIGEGYANRRMIHVWPDTVTGPVDSVESVLEGFYAAAGVAGLISGKKPADPLTNANVQAFTGVKHSTGYFTKKQQDRIAGGGSLILVQDADGQPLKVRHQLSTDTSSIEKREISVTTALDYMSVIYRTTLDPQIGIVNITDALLTDIGTKSDGLNTAFIEQGVCRNAALLSVAEDPSQSDRIVIEVGIRSLIPNNYNRVKLLVGGA